jgi:hypothetical protein
VAAGVDYPHHRAAVRDLRTVTKPAGAIEGSLTKLDGKSVVPLLVDGGAPPQFELALPDGAVRQIKAARFFLTWYREPGRHEAPAVVRVPPV